MPRPKEILTQEQIIQKVQRQKELGKIRSKKFYNLNKEKILLRMKQNNQSIQEKYSNIIQNIKTTSQEIEVQQPQQNEIDKELKLKNITTKNKNKTKNKNEPIKLFGIYEKKTDEEKTDEEKIKNQMEELMFELHSLIKKDEIRKVCPNCNELGHNKNSKSCLINIETDNKNIKKIKKNILLNENCNYEKIGVSINKYNELYNSICVYDLLKNKEIKEVDIDEILNGSKYNCSLCNVEQYNKNISSKEWKQHKNICDLCWCNYEEERNVLWEKIKDYIQKNNCNICGIEKKNIKQRFHFDHLNMFNKTDSVYDMVNKGKDFESIKDELNKCHLLCISCHSVITNIENNLLFVRIKKKINNELKNQEITEEEYQLKCNEYNIIYKEKMNKIYNILKIKI